MSAVITKAMTNITFTTCYNPAVVIRKNSLAGVLDGALGRKLTDFDNSLIFHKTLK